MRAEWNRAKEDLVCAVCETGFPKELAELLAKNLGSPKAIRRMTSYLYQVRPKKEEMIIDEMLAIMSEINAWKDKKASQQANASYNDLLNYGLGEDE
ncbi:MAG: hypothetical protein K6F00_09880 [Lachnospiraceae bacterium]|nr:hypothetical protein [Lachnospiraceae bacterium]